MKVAYLKKLSGSSFSKNCGLDTFDISVRFTFKDYEPTYQYTSMLPENKWLLIGLLFYMTLKLCIKNCYRRLQGSIN